jgi:DNA-binding Lrp family transcriptional regulator
MRQLVFSRLRFLCLFILISWFGYFLGNGIGPIKSGLWAWSELNPASSSSVSLVDLFSLGQGILDTDEDGLGDRLNLAIVIPDNPNPYEMAAAAEIAARLSFESLATRFDLVYKEGEAVNLGQVRFLILVGDRLALLRRLPPNSSGLRPLSPDQGLVSLISLESREGILVRGGSPPALLRSAQAFFGRFPYLWDIWGAESGETYTSVEKAAHQFSQQVSSVNIRPLIKEILYELPQPKAAYDSLRRLRYEWGEVKELTVELPTKDDSLAEKLLEALKTLRQDQARGKRTDLLSYANCQRLRFELGQGKAQRTITLERVGLPRRLLTPSFRSRREVRGPQRDFDLLEIFTPKGLLADTNNDSIPDSLEGSVIIPNDRVIPNLPLLGLRISLESAGMAWPIFYLADQVEEKQALTAPVLIAPNTLTAELEKTGKLKLPSLEPGSGSVVLVPQGWPRSNAVVIAGGDEAGLEKTIAYLSQTFPYLEKYGPGNVNWADVRQGLENFFRGEGGAAEAFFFSQLQKILNDLKPKELAEIKIELTLPKRNEALAKELERELQSQFPQAKSEIKVEGMRESQVILTKEKEYPWEGEAALKLIDEKLKNLPANVPSLEVIVAVSESPEVRHELRQQIEAKLRSAGLTRFEVKVLCAYKQGFFWLLEEVAPQLKSKGCQQLLIRVAKEAEDRTRLKRFYSDPNRWLQELYPVDELLARELGLPIEKIDFELKEAGEPTYEALAYDASGKLIFKANFSPVTKIIPYWKTLPEWGEVKITPSWVRLQSEGKILAESILASDLENFWSFYQEEILPELHQHIMKKTGQQPTTSKQPYFKQLAIEIWASEPDYRLNLDEEMVSSLEAIHDEIYFDTLDYLRGITEVEVQEREEVTDTSRLSAPGNVLPIIHPSEPGKPLRVKVRLEDWKAASPSGLIAWKEKGHLETQSRRLNFPRFKPRPLRLLSITWNGQENLIETGVFEAEVETENEYLDLLAVMDNLPGLREKGLVSESFVYPGLRRITLRVKHKDFLREIGLEVKPEEKKKAEKKAAAEVLRVPDEIISPEACLKWVQELTSSGLLRGYVAGYSYEGREVPVIEGFLPVATYVSLPRLVTLKPTLFASGRQHANEVSATNYLLQLAEKLVSEETWREYLKKINLILLPLENPDGAALAYELQKLTPYHSLHAGRYSSLGVDIGSLIGVENPLLPEARVRRDLMERWKPDIYLNLHGYPSHEWVQPFSNYVPYLFRDYWIPKGWFAFYRSLRLPIYEPWKQAGEDLKQFIIEAMRSWPDFSQSSQKFYERYFRWATRWAPHAAELELYDGVNLYARRRSSQETRLTPRTQLTHVEETPELMDETAHGAWLRQLSEQGLTYLQAHLKYLSSVSHDVCRVDEEIQERVRFQWLRRRPGQLPPSR